MTVLITPTIDWSSKNYRSKEKFEMSVRSLEGLRASGRVGFSSRISRIAMSPSSAFPVPVRAPVPVPIAVVIGHITVIVGHRAKVIVLRDRSAYLRSENNTCQSFRRDNEYKNGQIADPLG